MGRWKNKVYKFVNKRLTTQSRKKCWDFALRPYVFASFERSRRPILDVRVLSGIDLSRSMVLK